MVISIDPRRVYVPSPDAVRHHVISTKITGPNGEKYCWYQCTVKGGREGRDADAVTLAMITEKLGAGEILLNCIDRDGTNLGFDLELINAVKGAVSIPIIASSGAGSAQHFLEVFTRTEAESAPCCRDLSSKRGPYQRSKEVFERACGDQGDELSIVSLDPSLHEIESFFFTDQQTRIHHVGGVENSPVLGYFSQGLVHAEARTVMGGSRPWPLPHPQHTQSCPQD